MAQLHRKLLHKGMEVSLGKFVNIYNRMFPIMSPMKLIPCTKITEIFLVVHAGFPPQYLDLLFLLFYSVYFFFLFLFHSQACIQDISRSNCQSALKLPKVVKGHECENSIKFGDDLY